MAIGFNTASMIGTGISAGISAVGSIFTTRYNNAIAKAQANIAKENAKTMELQAQYTLFAAETKVQHETMLAGQVKARQKAALAANGVAIGTGSAAQITASTDIIKTINKNRIETDAHAAAWGYRQRATDFKNQALMFNAKKQSVGLNFMSTALNGLSQVGMTYAFGKLAEGKTKEPAQDTPLKVDAISGADPGLKIDAISSADPGLRIDGISSADPGIRVDAVSAAQPIFTPLYSFNPLSINNKVSILGR